MKNMTRFAFSVLTLMLMLSFMPYHATAADKVKLNETKLTMYKGDWDS